MAGGPFHDISSNDYQLFQMAADLFQGTDVVIVTWSSQGILAVQTGYAATITAVSAVFVLAVPWLYSVRPNTPFSQTSVEGVYHSGICHLALQIFGMLYVRDERLAVLGMSSTRRWQSICLVSAGRKLHTNSRCQCVRRRKERQEGWRGSKESSIQRGSFQSELSNVRALPEESLSPHRPHLPCLGGKVNKKKM